MSPLKIDLSIKNQIKYINLHIFAKEETGVDWKTDFLQIVSLFKIYFKGDGTLTIAKLNM